MREEGISTRIRFRYHEGVHGVCTNLNHEVLNHTVEGATLVSEPLLARCCVSQGKRFVSRWYGYDEAAAPTLYIR
eukprot:1196420-Prorocentrum_minimum.AAC.16